jgi:hypothetical protein
MLGKKRIIGRGHPLVSAAAPIAPGKASPGLLRLRFAPRGRQISAQILSVLTGGYIGNKIFQGGDIL